MMTDAELERETLARRLAKAHDRIEALEAENEMLKGQIETYDEHVDGLIKASSTMRLDELTPQMGDAMGDLTVRHYKMRLDRAEVSDDE